MSAYSSFSCHGLASFHKLHLYRATSDRLTHSSSAPWFRRSQRRIGYLLSGAVTGAVAVHANDLKQLQFESVSALGPLIRLLDPETAHNVGIWAAKYGFFPRETRPDPESLAISVWGRQFPNPIGVAAGFDKNAEAVEGLLNVGFGFVEIGSVTPLPQPGNPKPRCFRLREHR